MEERVTAATDAERLARGEANLQIVREYFRAIEERMPFEELRRFYTDDVVQREFPNQFVPKGATRGLKELGEAAARGRNVVIGQRYEVRAALAIDDHVAVEVRWIATLAVPFGSIPAGGEMTASFAVFFEMSEGRIREQRNYDCFDPW